MRAPISAAGQVHHHRGPCTLLAFLLFLLLLPRPRVSPAPQPCLVQLEQYRSSHSLGMVGMGPLASQANPVTLNPTAPASCFFLGGGGC